MYVSPLSSVDGNRFSFRNAEFSNFLEYSMMDKSNNPLFLNNNIFQ
jgi:hypothetical protein